MNGRRLLICFDVAEGVSHIEVGLSTGLPSFISGIFLQIT